jgi:hypothetical protein
MNFLSDTLLLLADRNIYRELGSGFRAKRDSFQFSDLIPWLIVTAAVLGGLAVLARIVARREKQAFNSPRALFNELCKAHGLDLASRQLLRRLARAADIRQPARMFVEPQRFEPTNLPSDLRAQWPAIEALRAKLFAQTVPAGNGAADRLPAPQRS